MDYDEYIEECKIIKKENKILLYLLVDDLKEQKLSIYLGFYGKSDIIISIYQNSNGSGLSSESHSSNIGSHIRSREYTSTTT